MLKKINKKWVLLLILLLTDKLVKFYIQSSSENILINKHFIFGQFSFNRVLYFLLVVLALYYFLSAFINTQSWLQIISYSLLISGILSQAIDRLINGYVIDYINIFDITTINMADIYIVCSVSLLIFYYIKIEVELKPQK